MEKIKRNKGITLIALVITIILILILAGIAISAVTNTGLFAQVDEAKKKTENIQVEEEKTLASYENTIGEYVSGTRDQIIVDKAEYEQLKSKIEELNQKISDLETKNNKSGCIDVSNEIEKFSITQEVNSYTATENCYITATLYAYGGDSISIYVNDENISGIYNNNSGWVGAPFTIILNKGDTLKFEPSNYNKIMSSINVWKIK